MVLTKETHNTTKIELARDLGARSLNGLKKPLLPLLNKILEISENEMEEITDKQAHLPSHYNCPKWYNNSH